MDLECVVALLFAAYNVYRGRSLISVGYRLPSHRVCLRNACQRNVYVFYREREYVYGRGGSWWVEAGQGWFMFGMQHRKFTCVSSHQAMIRAD